MTGRLFIFGLGFCGLEIARLAKAHGWIVAGTCTTADKAARLRGEGIETHLFDGTCPLDESTVGESGHILSTIAPETTGDPVIGRCARLLRRARWTGSQAGLKAQERRTNVRRAFELHPRWATVVRDKTVLLVDDVLTTGATVEACARALQRGGARHVDVLTLARVVRAA